MRLFASLMFAAIVAAQPRPRAVDLGIPSGTLARGPLDAITDVAGVRVGHTTVVRGDNIRTGVTVILPHSGNLFRDKVPGAVFVGNAFGKLAGSTQVQELGEIESPIALTSTLNVPRVADALLDYLLALPGNEQVRSINPLVGETNDGFLNDIRARVVDIQQSLDRILADTTPAAIGTSGSTEATGGSISVDRGRLLQLRRQLDALLAALNRP